MVIKVNILVDELLCFLKGGLLEVAQILFLEMAEEVFHGGIVPAVATSRHGRGDVILGGKDMIRLRSVLRPLVTMEDQSISDLFFLLGLFQGLGYKSN